MSKIILTILTFSLFGCIKFPKVIETKTEIGSVYSVSTTKQKHGVNVNYTIDLPSGVHTFRCDKFIHLGIGAEDNVKVTYQIWDNGKEDIIEINKRP